MSEIVKKLQCLGEIPRLEYPRLVARTVKSVALFSVVRVMHLVMSSVIKKGCYEERE
jgi:hypothetical protein